MVIYRFEVEWEISHDVFHHETGIVCGNTYQEAMQALSKFLDRDYYLSTLRPITDCGVCLIDNTILNRIECN